MEVIVHNCPSLASTLLGEHDTSNGTCDFRGIPYASLSKRWTFSTAEDSLPSPFDATKFGPRCPQLSDSPLVSGGTNDPTPGDDEFNCLHLNITSPVCAIKIEDGNKVKKLLPVMVWVHGGSFNTGSNSIARYRPQLLSSLSQTMGTPVIIVQINYRLGVFSFGYSEDLASETTISEDFLGDFGISDQYQAFQWVQNHIQDFGGDPGNVTGFGISAGSSSLHHQIVSGKPLFDRAILMSGLEPLIGRRNPWTLRAAWQRLSRKCCSGGVPSAVRLERLRLLPPVELLERCGNSPLAMIAEHQVESKLWRIGDSHPISRCKEIILGDSRVEAIILDNISRQVSQTRFHELAASHFTSSNDYAQFYHHFGFDPKPQVYETYRDALRLFLSTVIFHYPNIQVAETNGSSTYLYHFEEPSPYPGPTLDLPYHGQCALFMYQNEKEQHSQGAQYTSMLMAQKWIAFANGDVPWEAFAKGKRFFRFGPEGGCGLKGFAEDEEREYGYLHWLVGCFKEVEDLVLALREESGASR